MRDFTCYSCGGERVFNSKICPHCGAENMTGPPDEYDELVRLRAEVVELKDILREAPSALDEAGMEGNCEARGDTDGAGLHRANVKRWLTKVQAAISSSEQANP